MRPEDSTYCISRYQKLKAPGHPGLPKHFYLHVTELFTSDTSS